MLILIAMPFLLPDPDVAIAVLGLGVFAFLGNSYLPPMIGTWPVDLDPETKRFLPRGAQLRASRLHQTRALDLWIWRAVIIHEPSLHLSKPHLAQLINHEAAHFFHRDGLVFTGLVALFYSLVTIALAMMAALLVMTFVPTSRPNSDIPFLVTAAFLLTVVFGPGVGLLLWIRRALHNREHRADLRAYALGGNDYLKLLNMLERRNKVKDVEPVRPVTRQFRRAQAWLTHPSFEARIMRLSDPVSHTRPLRSALLCGVVLGSYVILGQLIFTPPDPSGSRTFFSYKAWMADLDGTIPSVAAAFVFLLALTVSVVSVAALLSILAHELVETRGSSIFDAVIYTLGFGLSFNLTVMLMGLVEPMSLVRFFLSPASYWPLFLDALKIGASAGAAYVLNALWLRFTGKLSYSILLHVPLTLLSLAAMAVMSHLAGL